MKLVGLTGGICCGKSTVVNIIRALDTDGGLCEAGGDAVSRGRRARHVGVVDCDLIAREVVKPGAWGYRRVVRAFGSSVLQEDGTLDRGKLGGLVFNDAVARKRLNAATHLPILVRMMTQILTLWVWKRCPIVVVDMPLLYEIGFQRFTRPYTIVVACRPETQVARLQKRDGLSRAQAEARVDAQMMIGDKVNLADYVLRNEDDGNGKVERDMGRLEGDVREIFRRIARDGRMGQGWWALGFLGCAVLLVPSLVYSAFKFVIR